MTGWQNISIKNNYNYIFNVVFCLDKAQHTLYKISYDAWIIDRNTYEAAQYHSAIVYA